jgi:hypothetical protein
LLCLLVGLGCGSSAEPQALFPGTFVSVELESGGFCERPAALGCSLKTTYERGPTRLRLERQGSSTKEAVLTAAETARIDAIVDGNAFRHAMTLDARTCGGGVTDGGAGFVLRTSAATKIEPYAGHCFLGMDRRDHPYARLFDVLSEISEAHFGRPEPQPPVSACITANDVCTYLTEPACLQMGGTWTTKVKCADGKILGDERSDASAKD